MTLTATATTAVSMELLRAESRRVITRAAEALWPDRQIVLGPQHPSVTSYICPVTVDGKEVIAKYGWLGMPLASVLRGRAGTWEQVQQAQHAYVRTTAALTAREAHHLDLLRAVGRLPVCDTAGVSDGALFTRKVPGPTLADALTNRPQETHDLLDTVLLTLQDLHGPTGTKLLDVVAPIGEPSVPAVFARKFGGPGAGIYLRSLGRNGTVPEQERQAAVRPTANAVARLRHLAATLPSVPDTVVLGNLAPQHVHLAGWRPRFTDPALRPAAGPDADIATLTGRTLLLALGHPQPQAAAQIAQGVKGTLAVYLAGLPARDESRRCRELLVLWLMDTMNILSTCLGTPPELPLPGHHHVLIERAGTVAALTDRASALLTRPMTGPRLLNAVFDAVEQAVSGR